MRLKSDFKSGWGLFSDSKRIKWQTTFRIELSIELLTFFDFFRIEDNDIVHLVIHAREFVLCFILRLN